MPRTKTDIVREVRQRRSSLLAWITEHSPVRMSTLREGYGEHANLSADVQALYRSGAIDRIGTRGPGVVWFITEQAETLELISDPADTHQRIRETFRKKQAEREQAKTIPGLHVVRLLDKPARQTGSGGQCAITHFGSLQCGQNYEAA